jgi:hypothetical protein
MTGRSTFLESCAASAGGSDRKAGALAAFVVLVVLALAFAAVTAMTAAGAPPSTADAAADMARTDKNLRCDKFPRPPRQRLCSAAARATLPESREVVQGNSDQIRCRSSVLLLLALGFVRKLV